MSKELDEMIESAMQKEKKSYAQKPKAQETVPESDQEENLFRLRNAFEHYVGKEVCTELEPKYAVCGNDGIVEMKAENSNFELEVQALGSDDFREEEHRLYATSVDGATRRFLQTVLFDDELETKLLAAIGRFLGKAPKVA